MLECHEHEIDKKLQPIPINDDDAAELAQCLPTANATIVKKNTDIALIRKAVETQVAAMDNDPFTPDLSKLPIPFEDFDVEMLKFVQIIECHPDGDQIIENFVVTDGSDLHLGRIKTADYHIRVQVYEKMIFRAKRACETVTPNLMYNTMGGLARDIPMDKLRYIATNMINDVLRQEEDPRLHSVCLSDISRGTVRALTRLPNDSERTYWATHAKKAGLDVFNDLARKLFLFFLEAGTSRLISARWTLKDVECVGLEGAHDWSVILYEDPQNGLEARRAPNHQITYDPTTAASDRLLELIKIRKDEVSEKLKTLIIEHKDLEECLRESRKFCYATMKDSL